MTWEQRARRRITSALADDLDRRDLVQRIDKCRAGGCNICGDLCPAKAERSIQATVPLILAALGTVPGHLLMVRFTKPAWARRRGSLRKEPLSKARKAATSNMDDVRVSHHAIEKAFRRSLDKMNLPSIIAVGMMDTWYGQKQWEFGAALVIAGAERSALHDAFPAGHIVIDEIKSAKKLFKKMMRRSYLAKRLLPSASNNVVPEARQREYYRWLAHCPHNSRLFRYGCDRYFNPLHKTPMISTPKIVKLRPYPRHLIPFMFGNHPPHCECIACGGAGKCYRPKR